MGQRLNIELTNGEIVLANCYFEEAATTNEALDLTERIIRTYEDIFNSKGDDLYVAVQLFEALGGGINGVERNRIKQAAFELPPARSVYDGVIAITDEGIRENRRWENGRVSINLKDHTFDFHVHYYTYLEEYIDFTERVPGCVDWDELPKVEADADIFTGIYFDHLYMIRRIVDQCPDGFKLSNGDVIEWI